MESSLFQIKGPPQMEAVFNGIGSGPVANKMLRYGFHPGIMRPWVSKNGYSYCDIPILNEDGTMGERAILQNAEATLTKDEWIHFDTVVVKEALARLKLYTDLAAASTYTIPNGMGSTLMQYHTMHRFGGGTIGMNPIGRTPRDRPTVELQNYPLPIIWQDLEFDARELATARRSQMPLDTTSLEIVGRNLADIIEQLVAGTYDVYSFGSGSIYGYTNFTGRLTKTFSDPTDPSWTPQVLLAEFLAAKEQLRASRHYGPFTVYTGNGWDQYLDEDWSAGKGGDSFTLRDRLARIDNMGRCQTADYLDSMDIVIVEMKSDTCRAIDALDFTTVQWTENGGFSTHFKVMVMRYPQLRTDAAGNTGILHGTVA